MYSYDEMQQETSTAFERIDIVARAQERFWNSVGFDAHFHDLSDKELFEMLRLMDVTSSIINQLVARIIGYDIPSSEGV
jgi:hypothetical protein